ncbi:heterokaryon incompatibility protein-domain-containing protein, partial [Hyaloscypha sp. PMI_1271]
MEVDDPDQYEYSQLNGPDAIRLIHLQACKDLEAGIECALKDATLAEYRDDICDHYIAISYVWGDQDDTRTISVDGKRLQITASLDSALRHVRDHRKVLRVWADGVCINQKDVHDRNRQVRLMGDIYSIAQHTIIFLGLSSPQIDSVLQSIASGSQPPVQSEESLGVSSQEIPTRQFETIVEDEILSRPWFTRVWILQELVLSQNPWLQCGSSRVRWHVFCRTVLLSEHCSWRPDSLTVLTHMNDSWAQARRDRESHSKSHSAMLDKKAPGEYLLELVCARRGCSLSDPRDMIYAHLGLVGAETKNMVPIDYEKTVAQLYTSMTDLYAQWIGIWNIIIFAEDEPERRDPSLPSWVVDWSLSK